MKIKDRHLLVSGLVLTIVAVSLILGLAWKVSAAVSPEQTPARTAVLKHGTVTLCGMMVIYMVDQRGQWFDAHFGQRLRQLAPQLRKFQMAGQLNASAELADYYPPVYWSCERLHEAQVQWGRANGASESDLLDMEKAFKHWRDTYKPPGTQ